MILFMTSVPRVRLRVGRYQSADSLTRATGYSAADRDREAECRP